MRVKVSPGSVAGALRAPASKSYGQRALAAALITPGITFIHNLGASADEKAARNVIKSLGAKAAWKDQVLEITSSGAPFEAATIHCGESGLCARLFLPIAALGANPVRVTGTGSLLSRPMKDILELLPGLGVQVTHQDMHLPVTVTGPLRPQDIESNGSCSSQFLSGLLFAFAAAAKAPTTLHVPQLNSYGYAQMTVEVLQAFGYAVSESEKGLFKVAPVAIRSASRSYVVPGDFSSAASLLLAGALTGTVTIQNLKSPSLQPDSIFLSILKIAGAKVEVMADAVTVQQAAALQAFDFDATHAPDLFPLLAILATQCRGTSRITGLHRLIHKESNRVQSISAMLRSFNADFEMEGDCLIIKGPCRLQATVIDPFNDHRIVMAAAIGALVAEGSVEILQAAAVRKSYPHFFEDLKDMGVKIEELG